MVRFLFGTVLFITCVSLSDGQPLGNHRITIEAAQMEQRILASIRSILPQLSTSETCGREKDMNSEYLSALEDKIKNLTTILGALGRRADKQQMITCKLLFEKVKADPTVHLFEDRCYLFGTQFLSWSAAQERCQLVGANLVSVMSKNMQTFVNSIIQRYKVEWGYWIGARIRTEDNKFAWIGNDLLLDDSYNNWSPGQPHEDISECVGTGTAGWYATTCSASGRFICEL